MAPAPRITATSDPHIERIRAEVPPGEWSAYVRTAIITYHAWQQQRGELDDLRAQIAELRATVNQLKGSQ